MNIESVLFGVFAALNIFSLIVVANDKRKSVHGNGQDRTPEGLLFFLAAAFGALGVYASMLIFRHKTRRWYFQLGVPLLILENFVTLYVIVTFLKQ